MAIIEFIGGEIKCKHCKFIRVSYEGRRKVHKCARLVPVGERQPDKWVRTNPAGWSVTLDRKKCEHFRFLGE